MRRVKIKEKSRRRNVDAAQAAGVTAIVMAPDDCGCEGNEENVREVEEAGYRYITATKKKCHLIF